MSDTHALPSLNALRAFEAAARLRSVSRAAAELHVTHGAVSRQLRVLEDELGLELFRRDGRTLRPNAAGERLLEACSGAFSLLHSRIAELRSPPRHEALVLGCPGSLLARWIIPRLSQLQHDLPHLRLHLSTHDGDFPVGLEGLDAALLLGQPPWPHHWEVDVLATERVGPVLSPSMARQLGLLGRPASALLDCEVLHTLSRPQAWPSWLAEQGLDSSRLRLGTGFPHLYYLLEAAVAGIGVAIAPQPLVAEDIRSGRLVAPWGFSPTGGSWALCTPSGRPHPHAADLATWLQAQLAAAQD